MKFLEYKCGGQKECPFYHVWFFFSMEDCRLLIKFQLLISPISLMWKNAISKCAEILWTMHVNVQCHLLRCMIFI